MRIAIQGEPGSNSHLAVQALVGPCTLVPCAVSAAVFQSLSHGDADAAVLPIENSLHGAVADHYDLLLEHDVVILAETALRIRHALIAAPGTTLTGVRRVLSHPVALNQCRRFFADHPQLRPEPFYDTAGAVKHVVAVADTTIAAIAAPAAASEYGGVMLQRDLEDDPLNFTRFFLLARSAAAESVRPLVDSHVFADKMSVAFAVPHRPGSLANILHQLAAAGADLTRIESRPVPGRPWEYIFFVDLRLPAAAHAGATAAADAIDDLLRTQCTLFRPLGRYGTVQQAPHARDADALASSRR